MKLHSARRRRLTCLSVAGAAMLALGTAACTTVSGTASGATAATAGANPGHITIGLASEGLSSAFPFGIANGVKQAAASDGVKAIVLDGKLSETTQESDIQTLIAERVSGIIIDVIDPGPVTAMIKQANAAGIPVMLVHGYAGSTPDPVYPGVAYEVDENETRAGSQAGQLALKADPSGGQTAVITGTPGYNAVAQRQDGFETAVKPSGKYQIVAVQTGDWTADGGYSACSGILQAHPHIALFYTESDDMAIGCVKAENAAGSTAPVVSIGGESEVKPLIADKRVYGTVCYEPVTEGQIAATAMVDLLTGKDKYDRTLNFYSTPTVTAANLGSCGWQW
jgi:ABC-type sugar transport system substrate-binding protein